MQQIKVLYEDNGFVVIDKPAGLVVNRAQTVVGNTIQDWMEARYIELFRQLQQQAYKNQMVVDFLARSGIVHRLDKDTSGVMVLAKQPETMIQLMSQFKQRITQKVYLAVVHGQISPKQGSLQVPLGRLPGNRKKYGVVLGGKMTQTEYVVEKSYKTNLTQYQDGFTLVRLTPKTGRTHQLRVVLRHLGYPIISDKAYVGRKRYKQDAIWCGRHFLHALELHINHPETGKRIWFHAPLPLELQNTIKWIQEHGHEV